MMQEKGAAHMFDLTIKEYLDAIQSLKIDDFIIFYFTAYFFVVLVQRALKMKVDIGDFRFSPEILASLILVQSFRKLDELIDVSFMTSDLYVANVFVAMCFVLATYVVWLVFLSELGIYRILYSLPVLRRAIADKKNSANAGRHIDVYFGGIFSSARELGKSNPTIRSHFALDLYISVVLSTVLVQRNVAIGSIFIALVVVFLRPRVLEFFNHAKRNQRGVLYKNERRLDGDHAEPINE